MTLPSDSAQSEATHPQQVQISWCLLILRFRALYELCVSSYSLQRVSVYVILLACSREFQSRTHSHT